MNLTMNLAAALGPGLAMAGVAPATPPVRPVPPDMTGAGTADLPGIRARPDARAPLVGRPAAETREIRVAEAEAALEWGLVEAGEDTGPNDLRRLARRPGQLDDTFPAITACFGTEPFWTLWISDTALD